MKKSVIRYLNDRWKADLCTDFSEDGNKCFWLRSYENNIRNISHNKTKKKKPPKPGNITFLCLLWISPLDVRSAQKAAQENINPTCRPPKEAHGPLTRGISRSSLAISGNYILNINGASSYKLQPDNRCHTCRKYELCTAGPSGRKRRVDLPVKRTTKQWGMILRTFLTPSGPLIRTTSPYSRWYLKSGTPTWLWKISGRFPDNLSE